MSREHEYKPREKITRKITRDGLVEHNAATGDVLNISQREKDFDLREKQTDTGRPQPKTPEKAKRKQGFIEQLPQAKQQTMEVPVIQKHTPKVEQQEEKPREPAVAVPRTSEKPKPGRLLVEAAKAKRPKRLHFDKSEMPIETVKPLKSQGRPRPANTAYGVTSVVYSAAHQKIGQLERENTGLETAHQTERAAETLYRTGRNVAQRTRQSPRIRSTRSRVQTERSNSRTSTRQTPQKSPKGKTNKAKQAQKRTIKKQYQKAARKKTSQTAMQTAKKATAIPQKAAKAVATAVTRHPIAVGILLLFVLLLFFMASCFSTAGMLMGGIGVAVEKNHQDGDDTEWLDPDNEEIEGDGNGIFQSPFAFDWKSLVSSGYGWRTHPIYGDKRFHKGVDIPLPVGTNIRSMQEGKVTVAAFNAGGYGYYIVIENAEGMKSLYAHCYSLLVKVGQTVQAGDLIALSGNTGSSTGPHLHLETHINGATVNPLNYVQNGG